MKLSAATLSKLFHVCRCQATSVAQEPFVRALLHNFKHLRTIQKHQKIVIKFCWLCGIGTASAHRPKNCTAETEIKYLQQKQQLPLKTQKFDRNNRVFNSTESNRKYWYYAHKADVYDDKCTFTSAKSLSTFCVHVFGWCKVSRRRQSVLASLHLACCYSQRTLKIERLKLWLLLLLFWICQSDGMHPKSSRKHEIPTEMPNRSNLLVIFAAFLAPTSVP